MDFYKNPWFQVKTPNPMASMRLFCFPYAGGSASIYLDWANHLPCDVEVIALQYPGRGHRFSEPLISNCDQMISQLVSHISPLLDKPFAFFGHSNGALISFELAKALQKGGNSRQVHHFLSGRGPVQLPRRRVELLHKLPDDEFKRKLGSLGGTPGELLESPELMEIFLPILRADFSLNETFVYRDDDKLNTNATILYGLSDTSFAVDDMSKWSDVINGDVDFIGCDGDHFFINTNKNELLKLLNARLTSILGRAWQARCYA
jgi:medium-chain acyl-[acyl-carrier-protein] hydrolase